MKINTYFILIKPNQGAKDCGMMNVMENQKPFYKADENLTRLDFITLVIFAVLFLVFNFTYWSHYHLNPALSV